MRTLRPRRWLHLLMIGALVAGLAGLLTPVATGAESGATVVASGLDNPRGLTVAPDGTVYVAEAGKGGDGPCIPDPENPDSQICLGMSGAVTAISGGKQARIVTGLPSLAGEDGSGATGISGVSALNNDILLGVIGFGAGPDVRATLGADGATFGHLLRIMPSGNVQRLADLAAYEAAQNPDGREINSNGYALVARGAARAVVADAGANDLLEIAPGGYISTRAVFPTQMVDAPPFLNLPPGAKMPMESVPTSVVQGADGAYYVGELTGFPFVQGAARVWRVAKGQEPDVYADGFTNIISMAFDGKGNLYVLEMTKNGLLQAMGPDGDPSGALYRVAPDGTKTQIDVPGLVLPGGVAIGPDGTIYISTMSIMPGAGQVLAIKP